MGLLHDNLLAEAMIVDFFHHLFFIYDAHKKPLQHNNRGKNFWRVRGKRHWGRQAPVNPLCYDEGVLNSLSVKSGIEKKWEKETIKRKHDFVKIKKKKKKKTRVKRKYIQTGSTERHGKRLSRKCFNLLVQDFLPPFLFENKERRKQGREAGMKTTWIL